MNASIAVKVEDSSSLRWALDYYSLQDPVKGTTPSIRLGGRLPPWAPSVVARIVSLAGLATVDAGGSRPMSVEDVVDALEFLKRVMRDETLPPWIGRLSSGGIQLTWRRGDVEVEAVFDRARDEREVVVAVGDNEWDAPIGQADSLFATVVDRLARSDSEHVAAA